MRLGNRLIGVAWRPDEVRDRHKKALVRLSGAAVRIAIHGVGVAGEEIGWSQDVDPADFVAQFRGVPRDPVQDPVGITFGQRLGPAVRRVEFSGRVATGRVRYLLQL